MKKQRPCYKCQLASAMATTNLAQSSKALFLEMSIRDNSLTHGENTEQPVKQTSTGNGGIHTVTTVVVLVI